MTDLQELYRTIDRLNDEELDQVQKHINQRRYRPQIDEDPQTKIAQLRSAVETFWQGVPAEKVDDIIEDMNAEYVEPYSDEDWARDEETP